MHDCLQSGRWIGNNCSFSWTFVKITMVNCIKSIESCTSYKILFIPCILQELVQGLEKLNPKRLLVFIQCVLYYVSLKIQHKFAKLSCSHYTRNTMWHTQRRREIRWYLNLPRVESSILYIPMQILQWWLLNDREPMQYYSSINTKHL